MKNKTKNRLGKHRVVHTARVRARGRKEQSIVTILPLMWIFIFLHIVFCCVVVFLSTRFFFFNRLFSSISFRISQCVCCLLPFIIACYSSAHFICMNVCVCASVWTSIKDRSMQWSGLQRAEPTNERTANARVAIERERRRTDKRMNERRNSSQTYSFWTQKNIKISFWIKRNNNNNKISEEIKYTHTRICAQRSRSVFSFFYSFEDGKG